MNIAKIGFSNPIVNKSHSNNINKGNLERTPSNDRFELSFKGKDFNNELEESLLNMKYENGDHVFDGYGPKQIAQSAETPEQAKLKHALVKKLSKMKTPEDENRFDFYDISTISVFTNTELQANLAIKLSKITDDNGKYRFKDGIDIGEIIYTVRNKVQENLAVSLSKMKNQENHNLFKDSGISYIVAKTNTKEKADIRLEALNELLKSKRNYKSCDLSEIIVNIETKEDIAKAMQKLCSSEDI